MKKATDKQILEIYEKTKSCWKTAEILGMCGQSVNERLIRLGKSKGINKFTKREQDRLREVYSSGILKGDGKLKELSKELNRTIPFLSRKARELGLTNYHRKVTETYAENMSKRVRKYLKEKGHPRGMAGKHHTKEVKEYLRKKTKELWENMSEDKKSDFVENMMKKKLEKYGTLATNRKNCTWKQGWREIGVYKKYFRSRWEANYARYLQYKQENGEIKLWEHEPETFWFEGIKRGCRSYLPDFRVTNNDGSVEYIEVKGWFDDRSKTKLKRMKKYYPKVKLIVIFSKDYTEIENKFGGIIPGWEFTN